jgi:hypothetical protein
VHDVNIELNRSPIGVLNVTFGKGALRVQEKKKLRTLFDLDQAASALRQF